ncbi:hypothetical protein Tco_1364327 [Tanacetum coccineum]
MVFSFLCYAKSKPNGKLLVNSIKNGPYVRRMIYEPGDPNSVPPVAESTHEQTDDELTEKEVKQMEAEAIHIILMGLPKDIYAVVDSCETTKEIWLRAKQMMRGSTIGAQEKKAKLFNEWEMFRSTKEKIASNLKFLNNLHTEWKRYVTTVHQTKDLYEVDYTHLYDFLKSEQNQPSPLTYMQQPQPNNYYIPQPQPNNNYIPQPSFNTNYIQQPMPNPEDILDPTTAMNIALALMAKAFKLNYSTPTNNNQITSSNPHKFHNWVVQNAVQNLSVQNVRNIVVPWIANQNVNQTGNGNVVAARAGGNGNENNKSL